MSEPIPSVETYMTSSPHTIGKDQTMMAAHEIMRRERIRHLPVLVGGRIAGIVSAGDLHLIETLVDVDPKKVSVEDAMTTEPYCVAPDTPLDVVVRTMAKNKYGCAIVHVHQHVVGIFTTVDACSAFAEVLNRQASE